jgi:hypothetical protein
VRDAWADESWYGREPGDEVRARRWHGGKANHVGPVGEPGPVRVRQGFLVGVHTIDSRAESG